MRTNYINYRIIVIVISVITYANTLFSQTAPAHIGLVYPLSSNGKNAAAYTNHFSLNVIAGVSKAETGVAVAGISNIIKDSATRLQVAGFSNHIGSATRSAQFAGFMNQVKNNTSGSQIAGFMNLDGSMKGFQAAGYANYVKGDAEGTQIAGFMNTARSNTQAQVAGFGNFSGKADVQIAGFMNKATEVNTQIGGFLNVARKVKGVQVGFINIADSNDCPIGIINIVKGGEKQVGLTIDETATMIASFKSGGRVLYGILGLGYNLKNNPDPIYALQAGIGVHTPQIFPHFRVNVEATHTVMTAFKKGYYNRASLGAYAAYSFGRVELFAGPTFNYLETEDGVGSDFVGHYIWSEHVRHDRFHAIYIGAVGGVQVRL